MDNQSENAQRLTKSHHVGKKATEDWRWTLMFLLACNHIIIQFLAIGVNVESPQGAVSLFISSIYVRLLLVCHEIKTLLLMLEQLCGDSGIWIHLWQILGFCQRV